MYETGQAAIEHALAEGLLQSGAATGGDEVAAGLGVDMFEHAFAVADLREEDHVHVQVLAQILKDVAHVVVNQLVAVVRGGDDQIAHADFQCIRCVVPNVHGQFKPLVACRLQL